MPMASAISARNNSGLGIIAILFAVRRLFAGIKNYGRVIRRHRDDLVPALRERCTARKLGYVRKVPLVDVGVSTVFMSAHTVPFLTTRCVLDLRAAMA